MCSTVLAPKGQKEKMSLIFGTKYLGNHMSHLNEISNFLKKYDLLSKSHFIIFMNCQIKKLSECK